MPAIKKKWKASHDEGSSVNTENGKKEPDETPVIDSPVEPVNVAPKPVKRNMPQGPSMLRKLDGEILQEKRKRFIPPAELKLAEWLENNFEKRTDVNVKLTQMYKHYTDLCQSSGSDILGVPEFNRKVKEKFGKTFGLQESSAYKSVLKERKIGDKKAKGSGIRMKDVVHEAINHFGNPWLGVRFFTLKQYIGSRYPALRVDVKPKILKRSLELGVHFGYIELVKGVGMAGYYKLPGGEPPKPKEKEKKEEAKNDGDASTEEKDKDKGDTETEASKEEGAEGAEEAAVKKKVVKKWQAWDASKISFSSPRMVEDTFPLAVTYQSAPKTASILKIRRYIQDKYGETVTDHRWRCALESGVKKGYWEHISGHGISGTIHLQMDDFDPSSKELEDMICAAVIACHEPKSASANQIKKYITKYHTEFNLDQRPEKFKKALQRSVEKRMLTQLTGLGAAGSYQLTLPFTPSPAMLAGEDDSDVEDDDEEPPTYVSKGTKSRGIPKVKSMEKGRSPVNKSKVATTKTSKQGKGRNTNIPASKTKQKSTSKKPQRKANGRRRAPSPLTDEEEDEEDQVEDEEDQVEYSPSKSRGRSPTKVEKSTPKASPNKRKQSKSATKSKSPSKKTPAKSPRKATKRPPPEDDSMDEEEEEEEGGEAPEYTPRKSKSRGGAGVDGRSSGKGTGSKKRR